MGDGCLSEVEGCGEGRSRARVVKQFRKGIVIKYIIHSYIPKYPPTQALCFDVCFIVSLLIVLIHHRRKLLLGGDLRVLLDGDLIVGLEGGDEVVWKLGTTAVSATDCL